MLSNQVLLKTLTDIKGITGARASIWDLDGHCVVATDEVSKVEEEYIEQFLYMEAEEQEAMFFGQVLLLSVCDEYDPCYILMLEGIESENQVVGELCVSQLENLIYAYKERLDKNSFVQNLLLDNFLLVDIYNKAKRLHIKDEVRRVVFVIQPKKKEESIVMETLKNIYVTGLKDFITAVDEGHIIFVKELETPDEEKEIQKIATTISDTISAETMIGIRIAYGTKVDGLKDVSKSYKEAMMALDVGRIFYGEKTILAYKELGIGRLIHQLPKSLCTMFLEEVLDGKAIDNFEEETLGTVYKFFENNLNVSETARQLFIHRNTLVYRLGKIQKQTGLDVRVFEDAMTFKIAMMVSSHMNFLQFEK